jgi:diguanylate cyclase (GGDEF)-like protein/PAS domain S-box-containing protein
MIWIYPPIIGILWATVILSIFVIYLLSRRRTKSGVDLLILLMASIALWSLSAAFKTTSVDPAWVMVWAKIEYLGVLSSPVFFFFFVIHYTQMNRWRKPRFIIYASIVPTLAWILTLTNERLLLVWKGFSQDASNPFSKVFIHGPVFYFIAAYDVVLVLGGFVLLARAWLQSTQAGRRQIAFLLAATVIPLIAGVIFSVGSIQNFDITPMSFLFTGMILAAGIFTQQLFELVPVPTNSLIENALDGLVVLDTSHHILNVNSVAEKLLGTISKQSVGKPVNTVLSFWPELMKRFQGEAQFRAEVLTQDDPPRYLDMHVSRLYDHRKRLAGKLLVFRDITAQRQTEVELARNVEELKIINQIGLVITTGLDLERILIALKEQCGQVASIDIFYVALYDASSSLIKIPVYFKDGDFRSGPSRDIDENPGLIGSVIHSRRTLYLHENVKQITLPITRSAIKQEKPTKSYIGIPLMVREQVIGVLSIQSHRRDAYSVEQVQLLERIAVQAAIAIDNARLYAEEQRLAIVDELTGVYNYRGLMELGGREVERARRFHRPLSAVFFDIDNFRIFNNTFSHATGNIVMRAIVQQCQQLLRSIDILARYGGDEFVVLLPETDVESAETVARRIVARIAENPIDTSYGPLNVTVSAGVTELTETIPDLAGLIDRANLAEHQAKEGQVSVVTFSAEP